MRAVTDGRDRDEGGRARNARPRDRLGRPLPRGSDGFASYDAAALPPGEALREAQRLIDEGRPFTAHEVLEAVWKQSDEDERELWRGLAQLAVGITHGLRGNASGASALLGRAAEHLAPYAGATPHGIAVDRLRAWALREAPRAGDAPPRLVEPGGESGGEGTDPGLPGE
jgi:hypothetical protein